MSSTPGNGKKKRTKIVGPEEAVEFEPRKHDIRAAKAITVASDRIYEAAEIIVNTMADLKTSIVSLANRNYREIQQSTGAVKQLVSGFYSFFMYANP